MKTISILIIGLSYNLNAQCIQFTYDAAGDLTARNICPQPILLSDDIAVIAVNLSVC